MRSLALVTLLGVFPLLACTAEDDARVAPVGTVLDGVVSVEGRTSVLQLPGEELRVTVGLPVEDVATSADLDTAPEGGSLVPLAWDVDTLGPTTLPSLPDASPPRVSVSLVADGRAYPLDEVVLRDAASVAGGDPPFVLSGSTAVAVAGEDPELSVRVEWDGLVQEAGRGEDVRDPGVAERLYSGPFRLSRTTVPCDPPRVTSGDGLRAFEPGCGLQIQRSPWVGGLGWAETGRGWLVATGSTSVLGFRRAGPAGPVLYAVDEHDVSPLTLDGESAVREVAPEPGSTAFWAVFDVSAQPDEQVLEQTDTLATTGGDEDVGEDPTVTTSWSARVPIG